MLFFKNDKRCDRLIAFIDHFSKNKYDVVFIIRIHTDVMCYLINFFDFSETHSRSTKTPQKMISGKKIFSCFQKIFSKIGILDDKSDPHSGSESSASEELSQHSNSIATSSTSPIIAAFTNSNSGKKYPK